MDAQTLDWSDIPFVLAVCEAGSLSGAARKLGVNHSTVFRRIDGVESRLGVKLFERLSHGYVMTAAGEYFFRNGQALQNGLTGIQLELGGHDLRLEGALTITTTDTLLYRLTTLFMGFQKQYPDIELRLLSGNRPLDLMDREADIALRPTRHPPEHWVGRNLLPVAYAAYAHENYLNGIHDQRPEKHRWIRLDDGLRQSPMSQVTAQQKPKEAPVTITNTVMSMFDLARTGYGIAVLPCYLGVTCSKLVRFQDVPLEFNSDLWLLAHPDMRRNAKVHAFFEFATVKIRDDKLEFC